MLKAGAVTTSSEYLATILRAHYGVPAEKVITLSWGIDTLCFRRGYDSEVTALRGSLDIPPKAEVLFSPRTVAPFYRIEAVVRATAVLRSRGNNVHLVVAVGGSRDRRYLSRLRSLAGQLRIARSVVFLDRELSAREMAILYNMADATASVPRNDQVGACVVEAMSCGSVPLVAPLEAYKAYLKDGENALVVDGDSPEEIAAAFERATNDRGLRERCRTVNPALVEAKESWETNSRKMETLYLQLIGARKEAQ
jgi:glycosyltransferase involved in cell wall biosynthesis